MVTLEAPQVPSKAAGTVVFGSQAVTFSKNQIQQLKTDLHARPSLSWIVQAVQTLPAAWQLACGELPKLNGASQSATALNDISRYLGGSTDKLSFGNLTNIVVGPLVVISHLSQYQMYLDSASDETQGVPETLGFCTGVLSAIAATHAQSRTGLQRNGGAAIRLSMLIGALIDAEQTSGASGPFACYSLVWDTPEAGSRVQELVGKFQDTYVSVIYDVSRATATTPAASGGALVESAAQLGIKAREIPLRGNFHSQSHGQAVDELAFFCDKHAEFQIESFGSDSTAPGAHSNGYTNGHSNGVATKTHRDALRTVLSEECNWYKECRSVLLEGDVQKNGSVVCFGADRCIPPSIVSQLGQRLVYASNLDLHSSTASPGSRGQEWLSALLENGVAVVGMACNLPGADDLDGFWNILQAGKSQHVLVPRSRFEMSTAWRDDDGSRQWFGNFVEGIDLFDNKFFKKSPREMASTDPQQRLMLQVAYQAVQQSGYLSTAGSLIDDKVGCYIGVGLTDYENNIACHAPTAYSATGNLKSFTAGKISHFFGWTGPGITYDTACSSSAVAVDAACKAILSGECTAALAGGVNLMTSPEWFHNLAGASFLSPTGQCKPFDAAADGYCRGEGVGAVFLKRYSAAVADGDQIIGVIGASAVRQNENCTAITVPNAPSLSGLFDHVVRKAGLRPGQVSVVEAHGTGTPVGDPAEYESVRRVFGGQDRSEPLYLGSVKGLVGHCEAASGIVALLKGLLMVHHAAVPPQASFQRINPSIDVKPNDQIEVPTSGKQWKADFRALMINNYGASGSNASLIVTQAPDLNRARAALTNGESVTADSKLASPFWISGDTKDSLRRYVSRLRQYIAGHDSGKTLNIESLSYHLARQANRTLEQGLFFTSDSIKGLDAKLAAFEKGEESSVVQVNSAKRPVVLCFGGQVSTFVGLPEQLYNRFEVLKNHVDECSSVCKSLGAEGLVPGIFQREPVTDTVKLQTMLFAMQYACARTWIDSGVEVAAVVGHSFGELTALCVSGALSLRDALTAIIARSRLVRDTWGEERGAMLAVMADPATATSLLDDAAKACPDEPAATIACYNGPRSLTLAGTSKAIDAVAKTASTRSIKATRLNVTNAFHSTLVEPLVEELEKIGEQVTLRKPSILFERATANESTGQFPTTFFAEHMRQPVFFNDAVQRLSKRFPNAVWLEAGSSSTITNLASMALGSPASSVFQAVNINTDNAFQALSDATVNLWKSGLKDVSFWSHHPSQASKHPVLLLPPHQFDKNKHWMELTKPKAIVQTIERPVVQAQLPKGLWTLVEDKGSPQRVVRFQVNTDHDHFQSYVNGHHIAQAAYLCPSTLQLDIAMSALRTLRPEFQDSRFLPALEGMTNHAPMTLDPSRFIWLDASCSDSQGLEWSWKMSSEKAQGGSSASVHVSGTIVFQEKDGPALTEDFARYQRVTGKEECERIINCTDPDEAIQGRNVYRAFSDIVEYGPMYRGVQKIIAKDSKSAGTVNKIYNDSKTWLDSGLADCFCQVAGIFVNNMTDVPKNEMYISDRIDHWVRSSAFMAGDSVPSSWHVLAYHQQPSDKEYVSDVFVFDSRSGVLVEMILGIHYQRVSKIALGKALARLAGVAKAEPAPALAPVPVQETKPLSNGHAAPEPAAAAPVQKKKAQKSGPDIPKVVREIICNLSGLEPEEVSDNSDLVELGIDSLMGMELAREIETAFKCTLSTEELMDLTDFNSLVQLARKTIGAPDDDEEMDEPELTPPPSQVSTPVLNGTNGVNGSSHPIANGSSDSTTISSSAVLEAFKEIKDESDYYLTQYKMGGYAHKVRPKLTQLSVVHILDAFEKLGCNIRAAKVGETFPRIEYLPRHEQFVEVLYDILENDARLVDRKGSVFERTSIAPPAASADELLQELIKTFPEHIFDHRLTHLGGTKLAECLTGKVDGIQLIFGSPEGREIASGMYGQSPINVAWIKQMEDLLTTIVKRISGSGVINILELGAGTGGTTAKLLPLLANLGAKVQYTVTDLSASLVAGARKRFKHYPFVQYKTFDIEANPPTDLLQSQHIVIATNCVHATHDLVKSTTNIRKVLRPDGMLLMLEMTQQVQWIDLVFGLLEGWWLFNDGRHYALVPPETWEKKLHEAGYGHVDWSAGSLPENDIQHVIIAMASGPRYEHAPLPRSRPDRDLITDVAARQATIERLVQRHAHDFVLPEVVDNGGRAPSDAAQFRGILVTGATGSLGAHLVAYAASLPDVTTVVCLNRRSSDTDALGRQQKAFAAKGLQLDEDSMAKLKVFASDTSKPLLGLQPDEYDFLAENVTHIVHNAWPMSITRPVSAFEAQFNSMRNLITLAADVSKRRPGGPRVGFQFISSIATVGLHPIHSGEARVPEQRMPVESVLPVGYGDAKLVCERLLDETLHRYPQRFRPMAVRIGQIAGSKTSGYWNPVEHFAFLLKSSQTLRAIPDLDGSLSWCPVNTVAAALGEIVLSDDIDPFPIYQIENPTRQPWKEMIPMLAEVLSLTDTDINVLPFVDWMSRVRQFIGSAETDNPAKNLADFLEVHFERMSCGDLILDTAHSVAHSPTLKAEGAITKELLVKYVDYWKSVGFLR
ncbi:hypothetical protein S40288_00920 [Stachybotrys chartarum IBT 40288]|nr:hypothetical protein S40288_00920 [Stachybotrys chartarum IBT 40288]